jgi:hypothetical protein
MTTVGLFHTLDAVAEVRAPRRSARLVQRAYADLAGRDAEPTNIIELSTTRRQWEVTIDGRPFQGGLTEPCGLHHLRRALNRVAMDSVRPTHTVMNASAVAVDDSVVALVGIGGMGKSTLAAHLALGGHGYVADDVVAVDPEWCVRAYHRPVGVRRSEAPRLGLTVPPGPFELGWPMAMGARSTLHPGGSLRLLVVVKRAEADTWVEELTPAQALVQLADQALLFAGDERTAFERLETLARRIPAVTLWHHDLDRARQQIERLAASLSRP